MHVLENGVTVDIFIKLRKLGPFKEYNEEDVRLALQHTLYSVVVYDDEKAVGMARVVGDGRICFFIKDVVVVPEYHKQGIGTLIMKNLFSYFKANACLNAYIGLMSTPNVESFYEKFGFIRRPNKEQGAGMILYYNGEDKYD